MHANKLPNAEDIKDIEFAIGDVSLTYFRNSRFEKNYLIAFIPATAENTTLRKPALAKETQISVL